MNGVKSYLALISVAWGVAACGKSSDSGTQKIDTHRSRYPRMGVTTEAIQGVWESHCNIEFAENGDYRKTTLSLDRGVVLKRLNVYQDANCRFNPMWERSYGGQYQIAGNQLRIHLFNLTVIPQHYSRTTLLNLPQSSSARFCKSGIPFETGRAISFSPISLCSEESDQLSMLDLRGEAGYGIELFLDDLQLYRAGSGF